jgi:hypothetical protein
MEVSPVVEEFQGGILRKLLIFLDLAEFLFFHYIGVIRLII